MGRHQILLPPDHRLDWYRRDWKRYDVALGDVALAVVRKYPDAAAIDVGANVGDTTAVLCAHASIPVLAIEGNKLFLPYLRENARRIGDHVEVVEGYVGPDDVVIDPAKIKTTRGTSSILSASSGGGGSANQASTLSSIIASYPRFSQARLLKIDTDGFDFDIIESSLEWLASARPVLFFEYDTGLRSDGDSRSVSAVTRLMNIGYDRFIVYDNFGNFLVSVDRIETFGELNTYLRSNRRHGIAVFYFDLCCFHARDRDLFDAIHDHELTV